MVQAKDLKPGDSVLAIYNPETVVKVSPHECSDALVRVDFESGCYMVCTPDHTPKFAA